MSCDLFPLFLSLQQCDGFVNTYGDDIIKLLLEAVSPKVVCTVLHLCLGAETSTVVVVPVVEESGEWREEEGEGGEEEEEREREIHVVMTSTVEMDDCLLCKTVLGFVKTLVSDYQVSVCLFVCVCAQI